MKASSIIPAPASIAKEALLVIGGALLAALIMSQLPTVRAWVNEQWGGSPH